ncbi:MAG: RloB family protein [Lachnospiraceae bacterium]
MPIHTYTNWNSRPSDQEEQVEPFRKYFFICEGANTETFYFEKLIDLRKQLGIHPLIDIRLWEKTGQDKNLSFAKNLVEFAAKQKEISENEFDPERDKMVIVFDGDIFEEKVQGYDELISLIEETDIAAVSNPGFELFLLLHIENSYENYIKGNEEKFLSMDEKRKYSYAYKVLLKETGINAKKNPNIGKLAEKVTLAIEQEKLINQDIHQIKGKVSSNVGLIIESIINEEPNI